MTVRTGADESIGRSLFVNGGYELELADQVLLFLRASGRLGPAGQGAILDVGANNGVTSIGMVTRGEFARAVALEPEPGNFNLLHRNIEQNHLGAAMLPLQVAAADREAVLTFELSEGNFGDHRVRVDGGLAIVDRFGEGDRETIEVPGRPLDQVVADLPDGFGDIALVWIDVQGFEASVIRGGSALWGRGIPVVSELWPYGLERAGTALDDLAPLVKEYWSRFAIIRPAGFEEQSVDRFGEFFDGLKAGGKFTNVIYLP